MTRDCATQCCLLSVPQSVESAGSDLEWTTESEAAAESDNEYLSDTDSSSEEVHCNCIDTN